MVSLYISLFFLLLAAEQLEPVAGNVVTTTGKTLFPGSHTDIILPIRKPSRRSFRTFAEGFLHRLRQAFIVKLQLVPAGLKTEILSTTVMLMWSEAAEIQRLVSVLLLSSIRPFWVLKFKTHADQ